MPINIIRASLRQLTGAAQLFNAYRVFYNQASDIGKATEFLKDRITLKQSLVMLAVDTDRPDEPVGFMQLYFGFSSILAGSRLILNDLYVAESARRQGIGEKLIRAAQGYAEEKGFDSIALETAPDNIAAKQLYRKLGFTQTPSSTEYDSFTLQIAKKIQAEPKKIQRDGRPLVVITGVTSGLGAAMVNEFAKRNWMIAGCGRSGTEITKLKERLGESHQFDIVDVNDDNAVEQWSEKIAQSCGKINILINNASIIHHPATTWEIPTAEFRQVMEINVMGTVQCVHHMKSNLDESAKIINISSGWGRAGNIRQSAYCASKFAIEGLTQSLALELKDSAQIAVTLDPRDGVATPMLQTCAPEYMSEAPTPEDWAAVAVPYILSINVANNGQALTCPEVPKKN